MLQTLSRNMLSINGEMSILDASPWLQNLGSFHDTSSTFSEDKTRWHGGDKGMALSQEETEEVLEESGLLV